MEDKEMEERVQKAKELCIKCIEEMKKIDALGNFWCKGCINRGYSPLMKKRKREKYLRREKNIKVTRINR